MNTLKWPVSFIQLAKQATRSKVLPGHGAYLFAETTNLVLEVLDTVALSDISVYEEMVTPGILLLYVSITKWLVLQHHHVLNRIGFVPQDRDELGRFVWNMSFRKVYGRCTCAQVRSASNKKATFWVDEKWLEMGDCSEEEVLLIEDPKKVVANVGIGVGCFEWLHDKHVGAERDTDAQSIGEYARELFFGKRSPFKKMVQKASIRVPKRYKSLGWKGYGLFVADNVRDILASMVHDLSLQRHEVSPLIVSILARDPVAAPIPLPQHLRNDAFAYHVATLSSSIKAQEASGSGSRS